MDCIHQQSMSVANTYLKHQAVHKYTWCKHKEDMENKSLNYLFSGRKNKMGRLPDLQSRRELGGALSDHMIVICKIVFCCRWYSTRNMNEKMRIRVGKLWNERVKQTLKELDEKLRGSKMVQGEAEEKSLLPSSCSCF